MSLSLGILIAIVLFFAYRGYCKGFFGALSRTISLIAAYIAALFLVKPGAIWLQKHTGLEGIAVYLVAGLLIFAAVSLVVTLVFNGLERMLGSRERASATSKLGGLIVGAVMGGVLGLLVVYGMSVVREAKQPETMANQSPLDIKARALVGKMVAGVTDIIYPDATAFSGSFAESPLAMGKSLQKVANNPDLRTLMSDEEYQRLLDHGDPQALVNDPLFKRLMYDPDVQYFLQKSELVPAGANTDEVVAKAVIDSWQGFQRARNDERVQEIINDPDFQRKLQAGDKISLMTDPQLQELTEAFFSAIAKARGPEKSAAPAAFAQ